MKTYNLSDADALFIQTGYDGYTEVYSKHEGGKLEKLASYKTGRWYFDNQHQQGLFFKVLKQYPKRIWYSVLDYIK